MASDTMPSTASPRYRSRKKPPALLPTGVSSLGHQLNTPSKAKPRAPPVPKRQVKSTNYYHASGRLGSVFSPSAAGCPAVDVKPTAVVVAVASGSGDCQQDAEKVKRSIIIYQAVANNDTDYWYNN